VGTAPDELTAQLAEELLAMPSGDRLLGTDPDTGLEIMSKSGRYGPYVTEVLPEGSPKSAKPRTASLFSDMNLGEITIDDALRLLSLPRVVGTDPADGVEITSQNGRYGPYLMKGTDSRSLTSEDEIFSVDLAKALELFAQPKVRGRGAAKAPLREVGNDPTSGKPIVVKEGRFGPYVTDGETNASLRVADDPMTVSVERASDLLSERRSKEAIEGKPAKKVAKRAVKKTVKKAPAKTTARVVKATKKTAAKKAAKKSAASAQ
jgi:DNA topoisomerase-1